MNFIDMSDYSRRARVYWLATTLMGAGVLLFAVERALRLETPAILELTVLVGVVFLAGFYSVRIPGTQNSITPGDIFVFLSALSLGPAAATILAALDALSASCRTSRRWTSRLGGPAIVSISIFVSASLFKWLLAQLAALGFEGTATLLAALLLFSMVHFVLNSLLVAVNLSLKRRQPLFRLWWSNYSWASPTYAASASAAGLIYLAIGWHGVASVLAAAPVVAIIFATCHFYFKQADAQAKAIERISRVHLDTVEALALAIGAKDEITNDHVFRVQVYACGLARHFSLTDPEIEALKAGALLHDVGKIAVPDYILNKPGKLTAAEFDKMKLHTVVGAQILERVNFPYPVVPIVRHHHERWDGSGYPDGLSGEQIPLTARILTVVDCFDALREDRQYRKGLTREEACDLLREGAGKQFDPRVVNDFLENLSEYELEIATHKESHGVVVPPSSQLGLSVSAMSATPGAGLAATTPETPEFLKQIDAAHTEVATLCALEQVFSSAVDAGDVVARVGSELGRLIGFTTCVVYLRHESDDSVVAEHVWGANAELIRGGHLEAGSGIAGWVVTNNRPMSNADPMLDLDNFLETNETGYRAAAVFPLAGENQTTGAIALYTSELESYNHEQLHLLETVARLAASALGKTAGGLPTEAAEQKDELSRLVDGQTIYSYVEQEIADARLQNTPLSLLLLDVCGLHLVNEACGHRAGDKMVVEVASLLQSVVGNQGFLSRIAGSEFLVVLRGFIHSQATFLGELAQAEVSRLRLEVQPDLFASVRLSFGVAEYRANGEEIDDLLRVATMEAQRNRTPLAAAGPLWQSDEAPAMVLNH